uniref:Uncharacterized protein n=1 Tax=Trichobilharzia regenti TaxID=157069 RepID=A0AA85JBA6_TRIRE|nr:unnamed protein product [Trichobilharzia regenti]
MNEGKAKDVLEHFVKHTERWNARRSNIVRTTNKKAAKVALVSVGFAVASYLYSIYAIRRNRYLDESFDQQPSYSPTKQ